MSKHIPPACVFWHKHACACLGPSSRGCTTCHSRPGHKLCQACWRLSRNCKQTTRLRSRLHGRARPLLPNKYFTGCAAAGFVGSVVVRALRSCAGARHLASMPQRSTFRFPCWCAAWRRERKAGEQTFWCFALQLQCRIGMNGGIVLCRNCWYHSLFANVCRFLTPPGRAWYIQHMLQAYNQLFAEGMMETWVAQQGPEKLAAQLRELRHKKA